MEQLNNPFVIYGYKGADYFCDRQKMCIVTLPIVLWQEII